MSEPLGVAGAGALTIAGLEELLGRFARRVTDTGRRVVGAARAAARSTMRAP